MLGCAKDCNIYNLKVLNASIYGCQVDKAHTAYTYQWPQSPLDYSLEFPLDLSLRLSHRLNHISLVDQETC